MVINIGELRGGQSRRGARGYPAPWSNAAHQGGAIVKVILETALLDDEQKIAACTLAKDGGSGVRENFHRIQRRTAPPCTMSR